ncbi:unnamed protein product [Angiostrongylus costaricensis]|uniref:Ras-associating domain-containing protein n=1 Tax=Angiostrongylus costaricensis TaxID=334426 RepID=A0A0R3PAX1_ANGCS|nr:unnamed protein product [Angiostrongylus costaricensis]
MIVTLLRKFRVADNPRKFALYECSQENDEETCTLLSEFLFISEITGRVWRSCQRCQSIHLGSIPPHRLELELVALAR